MPPLLEAPLSPEITQRIEALLAASPDRPRAAQYLSSLSERNPVAFHALAHSTPDLQRLIAVFGYSHFLSEECLQHPEWIQDLDGLNQVCTADEYAARLTRLLDAQSKAAGDALGLALFRRQQILRVLVRDVLGLAALPETTIELSNLADAILEVSYRRLSRTLMARHGTPRYCDEAGVTRDCGFAVIALGKLGGMELNYSSDIDLMFLYAANGETNGGEPISNKEFFKKVANQYTELLSTHTAEGKCYRVDLRLRPDGALGEACISLDGARTYYQNRARDWELQMLIKARVAAGDRETGARLLEFVEPKIYASTLDFSAVEAVSATRVRIGEKLAARRGVKELDVKLAPGGIRDIEFLVQCLQRLHGGRVPWVRHGGTLVALSRLSDKGLLSLAEHGRLASAYQFLRHLEHRLQFEDDRQTHALPNDPIELDYLALKMPESQLGVAPTAATLMQDLNGHCEAVREIYERVIHAQRPSYYEDSTEVDSDWTPTPAILSYHPVSSNLVRFLDQRAPGLASALPHGGLRRGSSAFENFLEKISAAPDLLAHLDRDATLAANIVDIFEHSPYLAAQLVRTPELMTELTPENRQPVGRLSDGAALRRFFHREMFALQAASLCQRVPVFETLERTSDLADAAILAAYRMAIDQIAAAHLPASSAYQPHDQMMVIALGRLGMKEFDLSSDADLIFVLPNEDQPEQLFWTRVAERVVELITAYTGEGVLFVVDTRLRPNGSAGQLLQSEGACLEYFSKRAEAWEGIAYMKSRAVAGDAERSTAFLGRLQEADWRRAGQSGRSKMDLRQMRHRLEKEQGHVNPLKAGYGGYYDIDFLLMYLRLKGAGIFFKVLNTPARIDVVEKMGHLERADADFLREAAVFYRALDHGLRMYSGHAEGSLPSSEGQLEALTELLDRWRPRSSMSEPLPAELRRIRNRTREVFDRLFS